MMNKIKRIVAENYDFFNHDFHNISKWNKVKSLFMSVSDGIFFYSNLILLGFMVKGFFKAPVQSAGSDLLNIGILSICLVLVVAAPAISLLFDRYSTIRKMTHFNGAKKAFNFRLMETELSLESLKILSENLSQEEMKKIFDEKKRIDFNSVYFMQVKQEKEIKSQNSVDKKEKQFDNLLNSLYKK